MGDVDSDVPAWIADVLYDPQTSGGLLIAVAADQAEGLTKRMRDAGIDDASIVGEFVSEPAGRIRVLAAT